MSDTIFKPPKVARPLKDQDNYHSWTVAMKRILHLSRLSGVVTGTETTEPVTQTDAWQDKAYKALETIIINCEPEAQILIEVCDTPAEEWKMLKDHYEGKTRTHLSALLLNVVNLKYDDRKIPVSEYITSFENKWNLLRLNTSSTTPGTNTLGAGIKNFVNTDAWKATMLLSTLPKIATYQNIMDNITGLTVEPSYTQVVLRLKELSERHTTRSRPSTTGEAPSAFATTTTMFCGYCKKKGFPGTSHNEVDCRTKKRDANKKPAAAAHVATEEAKVTELTENEWNAMSFMTSEKNEEIDQTKWWVDSCSTVHIIYDINNLLDLQP